MKRYISFFIFVFFVLVATNAFSSSALSTLIEASGQTSEQREFARMVCKIRTCFLTNRLILTVCTFAVSFLAIMIIFGRANWTMAMVTLVGILILTSAYTLINSMGVIPNALPSLTGTITIPTLSGNTTKPAVNISTTDPCEATFCFNYVDITNNLKNP